VLQFDYKEGRLVLFVVVQAHARSLELWTQTLGYHQGENGSCGTTRRSVPTEPQVDHRVWNSENHVTNNTVITTVPTVDRYKSGHRIHGANTNTAITGISPLYHCKTGGRLTSFQLGCGSGRHQVLPEVNQGYNPQPWQQQASTVEQLLCYNDFLLFAGQLWLLGRHSVVVLVG
jgi:hypothetical protein